MTRPSLTREVRAIMQDAARRAVLPHYRRLAASQIIAKSAPGKSRESVFEQPVPSRSPGPATHRVPSTGGRAGGAGRHRPVQTDSTAADDLVTVADLESEAILAEALARLLPEAAIVGEEAAFADPALPGRLGDALCWIIDPIDGTGNYAAGRPPFGILVALAQAGEAIGGWILDPLTGRFCHAERGQGAWVDGARIAARASGETPPVAAISTLYADPARREAIRAHIAPHYRLADIPRCAAEQYPRLALGINDLSIFERTLAWDHAAGVLFLNEAGGRAARLDGSPYRVDDARSGLVAAASPALWDELAQRLAALDDEGQAR